MQLQGTVMEFQLQGKVMEFQPQVPTDTIYGDPSKPIKIKISNGGAAFIGTLIQDYLDRLPEDKRGFSISYVRKNTQMSLEAVSKGLIDIGLTYVRAQEDALISGGQIIRKTGALFFDNYVLIGPKSYRHIVPKGTGTEGCIRVFETLVTNGQIPFVTRGPDFAEHVIERKIWNLTTFRPWKGVQGDWYQCVEGLTFPENLLTWAQTFGAFALVDLPTWLRRKKQGEDVLEAYVQKGGKLLTNPCCAIVAAPDKTPFSSEVEDFIAYLMSERAQRDIIGKFGAKQFDQSLFLPGLNTKVD